MKKLQKRANSILLRESFRNIETPEFERSFDRDADDLLCSSIYENRAVQSNVDCISINDEGIVLLDLLEGEVLSSIPMSIMHKNIELCENIDKLGMFLGSSDKETAKKNKPFSDLSEIMGKDGN